MSGTNTTRHKNDSNLDLENNQLKQKTFRGFKWSFVNQVGNQFLNLAFSIYLARLLSPQEYGLIAMITVFTGFGAVLMDFGFGNALIYKDKPSHLDWSSVLWINFAMGLSLTAILFLFSPNLAEFYGEAQLESLSQVLSCFFVLSSLSLVPKAKLRRNLDFRSIALSNVLAILVSGTIGVYLAYTGYGVWSLIVQRISHAGILMLGYFITIRWLPSLVFSIKSIKSIFSYSIFQFGTGFIGYWSRNLDNLLIGKFASTAELGVYNRAYSFLMMPINTISKLLTTVMMPSISRIRNDKEKVSHNFIRVARLLCFIVSPIMALLFLGSKEITLLVFGPKWLGIVPFLKLFSLLGLYQSILSLNGPIYYALGRTRLDFKINLFTQTVNLLAIIIGVQWGAFGVVIGLYIGSVINFYPVNHYILKSINLSVSAYYKEFISIILINLGISLLLYLIYPLWDLEYKLKLVLLIISYIFLYLLVGKLLASRELKTAMKIISSKGKKYE